MYFVLLCMTEIATEEAIIRLVVMIVGDALRSSCKEKRKVNSTGN